MYKSILLDDLKRPMQPGERYLTVSKTALAQAIDALEVLDEIQGTVERKEKEA